MQDMKQLLNALKQGRRPVPLSPEERTRREAELAAEESAHLARADRMREEDWQRHLRRAGVHEQVREDLTGMVRETPALTAARRWLDTDKRHLVLSGMTGAGKSVAAGWALRRGVRQASWTPYPGVFEWDSDRCFWLPWEKLRALGDWGPDAAVWERACSAKVLVVDDIGLGDAIEPSPRELVRLEALALARDKPRTWSVWTTNKGLRREEGQEYSPFQRYVGARVYSRIARSVSAVDCGAVDLRRREG